LFINDCISVNSTKGFSVLSLHESDIIQNIKSLPRVEASADFTGRVMAKVLEEKRSFIRQIMKLLLWNREVGEQFGGIISRPRTRKECAVCYGLTGAFYLVLGGVLAVGLHVKTTGIQVNHGVQSLPWLSFFVAVWLLGLALVMFGGGKRAVVGAKTGTALLIVVVLGASILLTQFAWSPASYISMALSMTAVFMGLLLYYQLSVFLHENNRRNDRGSNA
jgi:hypothetical protein